MQKKDIDGLYHLLRVASNFAATRGVDHRSGMFNSEVGSLIYGLARHILAGGDYEALVKFSRYYGSRFLMGEVVTMLKCYNCEFDRVVEFGAGLGWLATGIAAAFDLKPTLLIDKRQWMLIDVVADLDIKKDRERVRDMLNPNDLIVMCDFLHCTDDPAAVVDYFKSWRMLILEYQPHDTAYADSYRRQLARYGAVNTLPMDDIIFAISRAGRNSHAHYLDPYIMLIVEAAV